MMKKRTCKTCGADMPDGQDVCPECGCITYGGKKTNPKSVLFCGIIAFAYALYACIRDIISTQDFRSYVPDILIFGGIALIFGIISIIQKQNKVMNILGMSLAFVAIICSVCVNNFYDNNYSKKSVEIDDINLRYTFLCPTDMDYSISGYGLNFHLKEKDWVDTKYGFSITSTNLAQYQEFQERYANNDGCKKIEKVNDFLHIYYLDYTDSFAALYVPEEDLLVEMTFDDENYKKEIIKILQSMEIQGEKTQGDGSPV